MCDYCNSDKRDALKVNGKTIGHCCLSFFEKLGKTKTIEL